MCAEAVDHACGLRVVEQHDVAGADQVGHLGDVGLEDTFVARSFSVAQGAAVAGVAVQQVVHALGDRKERRFAVEDQPAVLDLGATPVGEQRLEHLGDAAAMGGGVDVPDRAVPERQPSSCRARGEAFGSLRRQDARQPLERERFDLDLLHPCSLQAKCDPSCLGATNTGHRGGYDV